MYICIIMFKLIYKPQGCLKGGNNIFMWREMYMEAQISRLNDYYYNACDTAAPLHAS